MRAKSENSKLRQIRKEYSFLLANSQPFKFELAFKFRKQFIFNERCERRANSTRKQTSVDCKSSRSGAESVKLGLPRNRNSNARRQNCFACLASKCFSQAFATQTRIVFESKPNKADSSIENCFLGAESRLFSAAENRPNFEWILLIARLLFVAFEVAICLRENRICFFVVFINCRKIDRVWNSRE